MHGKCAAGRDFWLPTNNQILFPLMDHEPLVSSLCSAGAGAGAGTFTGLEEKKKERETKSLVLLSFWPLVAVVVVLLDWLLYDGCMVGTV
jgi:hypothetical protein